jgi:hypothetical protein
VNPPKVTLLASTSSQTPYTYFLTIPYTETLKNQTYESINVTVDRTSSITVQIRDGNTSISRSCSNQITYYSCPFSYTNQSRSSLQLT